MTFAGCDETVYRVAGPEELPGAHARLIAQALRPGERVEHLVLCPLWESRVRPFGITAPRASHTLCLTGRRLLVSRDYHQMKPAVQTWCADRDSVVGVEFGRALLMSWAALHVRRGQNITREGFYFPRRGDHHVTGLLRALRTGWPANRDSAEPALSTSAVVAGAGYFHGRLLSALLTPDERCLRTCQLPPLWGRRRRWFLPRPACVAPRATLLRTDRAWFQVCDDVALHPDSHVFSHNALAFSFALPIVPERRTEERWGVRCDHLVLRVGGVGGGSVDVFFPEGQSGAAEQWLLAGALPSGDA